MRPMKDEDHNFRNMIIIPEPILGSLTSGYITAWRYFVNVHSIRHSVSFQIWRPRQSKSSHPSYSPLFSPASSRNFKLNSVYIEKKIYNSKKFFVKKRKKRCLNTDLSESFRPSSLLTSPPPFQKKTPFHSDISVPWQMYGAQKLTNLSTSFSSSFSSSQHTFSVHSFPIYFDSERNKTSKNKKKLLHTHWKPSSPHKPQTTPQRNYKNYIYTKQNQCLIEKKSSKLHSKSQTASNPLPNQKPKKRQKKIEQTPRKKRSLRFEYMLISQHNIKPADLRFSEHVLPPQDYVRLQQGDLLG